MPSSSRSKLTGPRFEATTSADSIAECGVDAMQLDSPRPAMGRAEGQRHPDERGLGAGAGGAPSPCLSGYLVCEVRAVARTCSSADRGTSTSGAAGASRKVTANRPIKVLCGPADEREAVERMLGVLTKIRRSLPPSRV